LGSMVQKGKLAASALALDNALKSVDFPTLGSPTIPHCSPINMFYLIDWMKPALKQSCKISLSFAE
jgi:hypothetical protein